MYNNKLVGKDAIIYIGDNTILQNIIIDFLRDKYNYQWLPSSYVCAVRSEYSIYIQPNIRTMREYSIRNSYIASIKFEPARNFGDLIEYLEANNKPIPPKPTPIKYPIGMKPWGIIVEIGIWGGINISSPWMDHTKSFSIPSEDLQLILAKRTELLADVKKWNEEFGEISS